MKCPICKKKFEPKQKKKTKSGKRFCSHKCQVQYFKYKWNKAGIETIKNRPKLIKKCLNCGKSFQISKCNKDMAKYCSQKCHYEYRKIMGLGKGKKCHFYIHGKGRLHYKRDGYVQDWDKISLFIKQEDDFTCQICGKRGYKLQAHHIFKFSVYRFRRLKIWNGITLCKECHRKIKGKENEFANKFLISNTGKHTNGLTCYRY